MLPMQADPILEWQRLTGHYREIGDDELCELAADFADLTETAQQALRSEMRSRGLGDPKAPETATPSDAPSAPAAAHVEPEPGPEYPVIYPRYFGRELSAALQQAGIESWVQQSREFGRRYARVLVAADRLDQARAVAALPIPREIVEEFQASVPDFTPPACPKCGAGDPVLEGVDPVNSWRCEQCGEQWSESAPAGDEQVHEAGKSLL
jgi:ribosomal protein L37AE/L43A